eukprot:219065-Amphidinium_carterae.1
MKSDLEIFQARIAAKDTGSGGPGVRGTRQQARCRQQRRRFVVEAEGGTGPVAVPAAQGPGAEAQVARGWG